MEGEPLSGAELNGAAGVDASHPGPGPQLDGVVLVEAGVVDADLVDVILAAQEPLDSGGRS